MKNRTLLLLIFYIFSFNTYAQKSKENTITLLEKADAFLKDEQLEKAIALYNKALNISLQEKDWENVARTYNSISSYKRQNGKYKESLIPAQKALEISNSYLNKNHLEKAIALDNIGGYYRYKPDLDKALSYYNQALDIKKQGNNNTALSRSYSFIGYVYLKKNKLHEATMWFQKIIAIDSSECNPYLAHSYGDLASIAQIQGNYKESLDYSKKALHYQILKYGEDHIKLTGFYSNIGFLSYENGNHKEALNYFKKAIAIQLNSTGENNQKMINYYGNYSVFLRKIGDLDNSIVYLNKTLAIGTHIFGKDHLRIAPLYTNLGIAYQQKGTLDLALTYAKKALVIKQKQMDENHPEIAYSLKNIASIYIDLKKYDEAITILNNSLDILIKNFGTNHFLVTEIYQNLATAYYNKKDIDPAFLYSEKAIHNIIQKWNDKHIDLVDNYIRLGNIYEHTNKFEIALKHYEKALNIATKSNLRTRVYKNIAQLYKTKGEYQKAIQEYQKTLAYNSREEKFLLPELHLNASFNSVILLQSLNDLADCYMQLYQKQNTREDLKKSIALYEKADQIINEIRKSYQSNYQDKITFSETTKEIYTDAIAAQYTLYQITKDPQDITKAFYFSEKSKSNTLKELITDTNAKSYGNVSSNLLELERSLKIDKAFYISKIAEITSETTIDTTKLTTFENEIFNISRRQDSLTIILEKQYPKYHELKYKDNIIDLAEIQNKLSPNRTILEFFTTDSITYAFVISKNNVTLHTIPTPNLATDITKLHQSIVTEKLVEYKDQAHQLYQKLISPIANQIKGDELVIIPDGILWHLNFELLLTQQEVAETQLREASYFFKEYQISYANSINLLYNQQDIKSTEKIENECLAFSFTKEESKKSSQNSAIAMSQLRNKDKDLPGSREEVRAISDIIEGQYFFGNQATETNFKKNASKYNILHLALHGEVDNENPQNSKLFFTETKDTINDNTLYTHELLAMQIPSELTILSACNTGTGKIANGEGIMSLGNAFQYAGTKSLLLSRWEVADKTTPQLMKYFYSNLKDGMSKSKALQQAKIKYLETSDSFYTHPFYWGSFYLIGDPTSLSLGNNGSYLFWIFGLIVLLLVILFVVVKFSKPKRS
ncbi:CHAT domain-containing protein [Aquimarina pacifica]|uniref:CHAT domain-containing protein n=1 Tax=Aquimarina pacifica TaxID=1296415 RepID=UPI00047189DF|nr:tetratricopeptide repeat protein [Aquimarina pacifica]